MAESASDAPKTPRNAGEVLDSGVNAASPTAERDTEPVAESRDTELDAGPPEPERTPVAGSALAIETRADEDTLLSAPRPADRLELVVEDRLAGFEGKLETLEARLDTIDARLAAVERRAPEPKEETGRWWIWVFFLVALAVAWKALEALK